MCPPAWYIYILGIIIFYKTGNSEGRRVNLRHSAGGQSSVSVMVRVSDSMKTPASSAAYTSFSRAG